MDEEPQQTMGALRDTPVLAMIVSAYHLTILLVALYFIIFWITPADVLSCTPQDARITDATERVRCEPAYHNLMVFAVLFGALGSTLNASRTVVLAVRHKTYDEKRILWQLLTPVHGVILAIVANYVVQGGLLALASPANKAEQYGFFVGGFSFIVGFSSETFVKRLIMSTEALFGERANLESETQSSERPNDKP